MEDEEDDVDDVVLEEGGLRGTGLLAISDEPSIGAATSSIGIGTRIATPMPW